MRAVSRGSPTSPIVVYGRPVYSGLMVRVCIDGYNLGLQRGTGIATYGRALLETARRLGCQTEVIYAPTARRSKSNIVNEANIIGPDAPPIRRLHEKIIRRVERQVGSFGAKAWPVDFSGEVLWPEARGGPPAADGLWAAENIFHRAFRTFRQTGRPLPITFDSLEERPAPDIVHWTTAMPLYAPSRTNIYTIHDLIPLKAPHTTIHDRDAFMKLHSFVARRADRIAVVSESTRQDVVRLLGVNEDRVSVTYQTVSIPDRHARRASSEVAHELEATFNLGWKDYYIHYGAIEPKKNLGRIVEAYLSSGSLRPLVIAGGRGWLEDDETALIAQVKKHGSPGADRIMVMDYVSQGHLISLIRGARALLFPSLYEGFGLPVLEAMTLNTAVLTSHAGALPEVAGQAAVQVDAENVESIRKSIRALDEDDHLVEELQKLGQKQAAKFNAENYEERLKELYII